MHEFNGGSCDATIQVKYMPEAQSIAYPLSRLSQAEGPAKPSLAHKVSDDFTKFVAVTATPKAMTTREIEETSEEDEEFVELRVCINNGNWKGDKLKHFCKRRAVSYREADPKSP